MTEEKRCKGQRIVLLVLVVCVMLNQLNVLLPFPRSLSSTSVGTVRHVKSFHDDNKEINKKDVPTEPDLVHNVSKEEEVKTENKDTQPKENHGETNKTIASLASLERSDNTVDKEGKVAVPLKPQVNNGGGKVPVPSKPEETHSEPKVTATTPVSQGESDNAVDDASEVAVPSKPQETHDESKVPAQKSAPHGEGVSTVDGERKGDKGDPESTGKSSNVSESSKKVANMKEKPSFEKIVLLGERHSGTTYTTSLLRRCFPSVHVDDFLVRFKHWFQPDPDFVVNTAKDYFIEKGVRKEWSDMMKIVDQWPRIAALDDPKSMAFNKTLVVVMFRNPYDWLNGMKNVPHHWSNHFKTVRINETNKYGQKLLSWNEFVAANMTVGATNAGSSQLCQKAYPAGMVSPCIVSKDTYPPNVKKDYGSNLSAAPNMLPFGAHHAIYELDANGNPFHHPLELRTAKIKNFLDIPNKWDLGGFFIFQQEKINMNGTAAFLEHVSKIVGMKPSCDPDPPRRQPPKKLDDAWTKWISEHADWETEAKVGYQRHAGDNNVDKEGKVAVPLKPQVNNGGGKVPVPSKPEETHSEPKGTATTPVSQGESDNAVDDTSEVAVPSKPQETHDESKVPAQKSAPHGEGVSTVDGERKGDKGDPESTGKSSNVSESSKKVANMKEKPSFEKIVLLGERHSGTTYTTSLLRRCFPSVHVDDFLVRFKHWFQPDPDFVVNTAKDYFIEKGVRKEWGDMMKIVDQWPRIAALDDPKSMAFNKTLAIVMFRNPYDWLDGMKNVPHHWSNHFKTVRINETNKYCSQLLSWNEFVAANMTVGATNAGSSQLCQKAYPAGMVSPCIVSKDTYPPNVKKDYGSNLSAAPNMLPFGAHHAIYELDANGNPFHHPLELRTAKIKNFLDIPNKWDLGGFFIFQQEEINMNGTAAFLERVSKIVGMKPSCDPDPPRRQPPKKLDDAWMKWISEHADWETEAKVGYQRRAGAQAVGKKEASKTVTPLKEKANPPGSTGKK